MNLCGERGAHSKFTLLLFTFHWALSELLYSRILKVSQECGVILGPLFSAVNVHNLIQEYTCPDHSCNLRLAEPLALSCSKSSESTLAVAARPLVLMAKSPGDWAGKWEHPQAKVPQIPTVITEFHLWLKHKHFSYCYIPLTDSRVLKMVVFINVFQLCNGLFRERICPPHLFTLPWLAVPPSSINI